MNSWRTSVIFLIVAGIFCEGCRTANPHDHGGTMLAEYRPGWRFRERKAPYSAVYVLFAWTRNKPPGTEPTTQPAVRHPERAYQIKQVFARKGENVGFGRKDGSLIGFAGPNIFPLEDAHYCWHMLPGDESRAADERQNRVEKTFEIIGLVVLAASVVGIIVLVAKHPEWDIDSLFDD